MVATTTLKLFLSLRLVQHIVETWLARTNHHYWSDVARQKSAQSELSISEDDMTKTVAYSEAKYKLGRMRASVGTLAVIAFIGFGGLGAVESAAMDLAAKSNSGNIVIGLLFFGILILLSQVLGLPFAIYNTFVVEEKFGFNKQTPRGFATDLIKGFVVAVILGAPLLATILWIMEQAGPNWWVWAWAVVSLFSLLTAWIYPTLLAPIFNKFKPLDEGELKTKIYELANKVGFKADGISVMDASTRSSHGNAYFTGIFGKKRIVLFDTLLQDVQPVEVTAVLAHELGHFKLHHVRNGLIRGLLTSLFVFYLMGLMLPKGIFYEAFQMAGVSNYGGLTVFSLWFGLIEFVLQPFESWLSRRNEFAADRFAREQMNGHETMSSALRKLREKSFVMPISHPIYSAVYHSHPPMLERLRALREN